MFNTDKCYITLPIHDSDILRQRRSFSFSFFLTRQKKKGRELQVKLKGQKCSLKRELFALPILCSKVINLTVPRFAKVDGREKLLLVTSNGDVVDPYEGEIF